MKRLLILTGAGASAEFGIPGVKVINQLFDKWGCQYTPILKGKDYQDNLYRWVKDLNKGKTTVSQNFEHVIHQIQTFASLGMTSDSESSLFTNLTFNGIFPQICVESGVIKVAEPKDFSYLNSRLNSKLLELFRKQCLNISLSHKNEINTLRKFFLYLKSHYQIGIINLNYDNIINTALPELFTGFNYNTGEFEFENFYRNKWEFCYHLHGSIHFELNKNDEINWQKDLNTLIKNKQWNRRGYLTQEGGYHPYSTIITGLDKINQINREPFRQYLHKVDALIYESDAILIIGYGFNDLYLNNLLRTHSIDKSKRRNIVVIDYKDDITPSLFKSGDDWGGRLLNATWVPFYKMGNGSEDITYRPKTVETYKKTNEFEFSVDIDNPLYVWYSGFLNAAKKKQKVLKALEGYSYRSDAGMSDLIY